MATVTRKSSPPPPSKPSRADDAPPSAHGFARAADRAFRFLASLKLAMISLLSLSALLVVAMFVDSRFGSKAAVAWVYNSPAFAVVLAFLGVNILCAALIRYPWTKRQTGFVITHAGLITVLVGGLVSYWAADEGVVGLVEGEGKDQKETTLVRTDYSTMRVKRLDPKNGRATEETAIPFNPGILTWKPGRRETLSEPGDAFKLVMTDYLSASAPRYLHEPVKGGAPMIKLGLRFQPPNVMSPIDPISNDYADRLHWLVADDDAGRPNVFRRASRDIEMVAQFNFQFVDDERMVQDFLNPPKDPTKDQLLRFFYKDRGGKEQVFDKVFTDADLGRAFTLPDGDLTATITKAEQMVDKETGRRVSAPGWSAIPFVEVKLRKGKGQDVLHHAFASLPALPNVMPEHGGGTAEPLARLAYFFPPLEGHRGLVEVMGTDKGKLYYRVFGRDGLRGNGEIKQGENVLAFGGKNQPMQASFSVDEYIPSGREKFTYVPIELAVGDLNKAIPAAKLEMTVDGETRDFWVRKAELRPDYRRVTFPREMFEVAYDVDRKPLGFKIDLDDFNVGVDPGTQQASSYESKVRLTDEAKNIKDEPVSISMNEPLTHRGWTFYQSSFQPLSDEDGHETGQFMSILQVGYDPGRVLKYFGCLLVVMGTFVQFYMRAGVFSDGGKQERARAQAREARRLAKQQAKGRGGPAAPSTAAEPPIETDFEEL